MSATRKSIVFVKAAMYCLADAFIIAMATVNGDPKYQSYRNSSGLKKPVEDFLKLPELIYVMREVLKNFSSSRCTFRTTKLLFMMV